METWGGGEKEFLAKIMQRNQKQQEQTKNLPKKRQFGSAKGKFLYPMDFDEDNEEIAKLFGAGREPCVVEV